MRSGAQACDLRGTAIEPDRQLREVDAGVHEQLRAARPIDVLGPDIGCAAGVPAVAEAHEAGDAAEALAENVAPGQHFRADGEAVHAARIAQCSVVTALV